MGSVPVTAEASTATVGLYSNSVKPKTRAASSKSVNVGVRFASETSGDVVGLQFYRTTKQKKAYLASLWTTSGQLLARAKFPKSSKTGWQSVRFAQPVTVSAGITYVASYLASDGRYAVVRGAFASPYTVAPLSVPANGGVRLTGKTSKVPTRSYSASSYLVDVMFSPAVSAATTSPAPTTSPTPTTTAASPTTPASPTTSPSPTTTSASPTSSGSPTASASPTATSSTGCPSGQIGTAPDCVPAPPVAAAAGKNWRLTFNDDFSGSSVDSSKWTTCFDWNYGSCSDSPNQGRERYMASQVQVNNGMANLVAEPLSPAASASGCYQGKCDYKSGMISTARLRADDGSAYRYSFTYGYVESRMKLASKPGFFTAFWMLPNSPSYSYDTEIDIAEVLGGNPNTVFMTYHYNGRGTSYTPNVGNGNNGACQVKDYTKDFVRIGVDWQADHIAWYLDGVKCGQFNGNTSTIEDGPMHIILEQMVDNAWQRDWKLTSTSGAKDTVQVDYVRVYQQR